MFGLSFGISFSLQLLDFIDVIHVERGRSYAFGTGIVSVRQSYILWKITEVFGFNWA